MSAPEERNPSPTGGVPGVARSTEVSSFQARREPFGVARSPEVKPSDSSTSLDPSPATSRTTESQEWLNRTLAAGREERARQPAPATATPRKRPGLRRVKRVVRHVDPLSVLKMSFFYAACFLVVWLLFVAVIFWIAESQGFIKQIEDLMEAFAFEWNENISLFFIERWAFLIGLTMAILGALMSVFVVFLYNVAADLFGGIELTHVERDL